MGAACPSQLKVIGSHNQPSATGSRLDRSSHNYSEFGTHQEFLQPPQDKYMWNQKYTSAAK